MKTLMLLVLICASSVLADPIKFPTLKANGKEYTDVVVSAVEADGIKITHSGGIARIPFEQLDEATRKLFPFDPIKAKEARKAKEDMMKASAQLNAEKRQADEAKKALEKLNWLECDFKVNTVLQNGLLVERLRCRYNVKDMPDGLYTRIILECDPDGFAEDDWAGAVMIRDGVRTLNGAKLQHWIIKPGTTVKKMR